MNMLQCPKQCRTLRSPYTRCPKPIYKLNVNPITKINVTNNMEHNDFADIRHVVNRSDILFDTRICLKTTITETTIFTLNTHSAISNGYAMSTVCCVI